MRNKKSFTLIEVMISIALFSIIILFLYQTLDMNQKSNNFYENKLESFQNQDNLKFVIYEDILDNIAIDTNQTKVIVEDKNNNMILRLNSSNTFHNPFFNNITYLLGKNGELLRIESKEYFNTDNLYDVLKDSYVDTIYSGVEKFRVVQKNKGKEYAVYIRFEDGEKIFLTVSNPKG